MSSNAAFKGVDMDAAGGDAKYATEVKTTINGSIFSAEGCCRPGCTPCRRYFPLLGVLRLSPLSDWLFAKAEYLEPGRLALE